MKCIVCGKEGATYPLCGLMYHETEGCHPGLTQEEYDAWMTDPVKKARLLDMLLHLRDACRVEFGIKPDA